MTSFRSCRLGKQEVWTIKICIHVTLVCTVGRPKGAGTNSEQETAEVVERYLCPVLLTQSLPRGIYIFSVIIILRPTICSKRKRCKLFWLYFRKHVLTCSLGVLALPLSNNCCLHQLQWLHKTHCDGIRVFTWQRPSPGTSLFQNCSHYCDTVQQAVVKSLSIHSCKHRSRRHRGPFR